MIRIIWQIEDIILWVLLLALILTGVLQIVLRNWLDFGILWYEPLVRVLVLWLALAGAMVASRYDKHIQIDLLDQFLKPHQQKIVNKIIYLIGSVISLFVAYISIKFVIAEYKYGEIAFSIVPSWLTESIIPFAFFIIGIRFLLRVFINSSSTLEES